MNGVGDANADRFGRIERRGIDAIPDTERHGRPRELFGVWTASNTLYLYIVLGFALVALGLSPLTAIAVAFAGNLFWVLVGLLSISGPEAGVPSAIVTRAMFGVRGNLINVALVGWVISVAYEAINLSVGALAAFALLGTIGHPPDLATKLAVVAAIAAVTLAISVYGHATIVGSSAVFALLLGGLCVCVACYVVPHATPFAALQGAARGAARLAAIFSGLTLIASGPLSWGTGADYARYLPRGTSPRAVFAAVTLGGFLPSFLLCCLGVLAATAIDITDPQRAFAHLLPSWLYPLFLGVIVLGAIMSNVLTAYSSGLELQALGVALPRAFTVAFDGVVGTALAAWALFVSDFTSALENILALSVVVLGPSVAIYAADILLRRNAYDAEALACDTPASPFWGWRGFRPAGLAALALGALASLLSVDTPLFAGPVARAMHGADLSTLAGPLVASLVYILATMGSRVTSTSMQGEAA